MSERKLATIQRIAEVKPIVNSDNLEYYRVLGWWIVDTKGKYVVGDLVIFVEIDAWVPHTVAPFLSKGKEPRVYQEIAGERLRSIKLRNHISQGLLLSFIDTFDNININLTESNIGSDVSEHLGIIQWQPPAEFKHADAKGLFPAFIPKTDQPRIQNIQRDLEQFLQDNPTVTFEVTEKLEGMSLTVFYNQGEFGICSRNLQLKEDIQGNTFVDVGLIYKQTLVDYCEKHKVNLAIQGELIGPGIQGNIYGLHKHEYQVFDIFDIDNQRYLEPHERWVVGVKVLGFKSAPCIDDDYTIKDASRTTVESLLEFANGMTAIEGSNGKSNSLREGLCLKANHESRFSLKIISDQYLLKSKL